MVNWVVDKGLDKLLAQINAAAPNRRKDSDGSIGDAAHQARESDHNPESPPPAGNPDNQVDARDFTQDPANGADMAIVSESIRHSKDQRVKYVIFSRRIFYSYVHNGVPAFTWQPYTGTDPHENHMHVSVNDVHHDETQAWEIGIDGMATLDEVAKRVEYIDARVEAFVNGRAEVVFGNAKGTDVVPNAKFEEILKALADLTAKVDALAGGSGSVPGDGATAAEVQEIVHGELGKLEITVKD